MPTASPVHILPGSHAINLLLDVSRKLGCASYFPPYFDSAGVCHLMQESLSKNTTLDEDLMEDHRKSYFFFITDEQVWFSCMNEREWEQQPGLVLPHCPWKLFQGPVSEGLRKAVYSAEVQHCSSPVPSEL